MKNYTQWGSELGLALSVNDRLTWFWLLLRASIGGEELLSGEHDSSWTSFSSSTATFMLLNTWGGAVPKFYPPPVWNKNDID